MTEKAIVRAMKLLELLGESDGPVGVSELARQLRWTKSGTHRVLNTFASLGYVRRSDDTQLYELNFKVLQLASKAAQRLDLRKASLSYLRQLLDLTGETARLSILAGEQAICIEQFESSHPVTVQTQVGGILPLACSATGKVLLAFQNEEFVDRIAKSLVTYNDRTLSTRPKLLRELTTIRSQGYAINRGERHLTVSGVAAPVRDRYGKVEAAIGISGPSDRLPNTLLVKHGQMIKRLAEALSEEMGWSPERKELLEASEAILSRPRERQKAKVAKVAV